MSTPTQSQIPRAQQRMLRALAVLLVEAGAEVLRTGLPARLAGGVLKVQRRKTSVMWDPLAGRNRECQGWKRLVWRGPKVGAR